MSDSAQDVVFTSRGITVRKSLMTDQFQSIGVVFAISSTRDDSAHIRLIDTLPDDVPMDDIGFDPEYGMEFWSTRDDSVVFERTIAPGEEVTTVFGVRNFDLDEKDPLLGEPTLRFANPTKDANHDTSEGIEEFEDIVDREKGDSVRELIEGDRESLPGLETGTHEPAEASIENRGPVEQNTAAPESEVDTTEATKDEDIFDPDEPFDLPDQGTNEFQPDELFGGEEGDGEWDATEGSFETNRSIDTESSGPGTESTMEERSGTPSWPTETTGTFEEESPREVAAPGDSIAQTLAEELQQGNVSEEYRDALREQLVDVEGSTEARIGHLQRRVSDLEAYSDAMEVFLDEYGEAEAILQDMQDQVASLEEDFSRLDSQLTSNTESIERLQQDVDDHRDHLGTLETQAESLRTDIDSIHEEINDLKAFQSRLTSVLGSGDGD